jgi:hypothetical protein
VLEDDEWNLPAILLTGVSGAASSCAKISKVCWADKVLLLYGKEAVIQIVIICDKMGSILYSIKE